MHPYPEQGMSDSLWLLYRRDLAPEEFTFYLIERAVLVLRSRLSGAQRKPSTPPQR